MYIYKHIELGIGTKYIYIYIYMTSHKPIHVKHMKDRPKIDIFHIGSIFGIVQQYIYCNSRKQTSIGSNNNVKE